MIRTFEEFPEIILQKYKKNDEGYRLLFESWYGTEGGKSILDDIVNFDGTQRIIVKTPLRKEMEAIRSGDHSKPWSFLMIPDILYRKDINGSIVLMDCWLLTQDDWSDAQYDNYHELLSEN